MLDFYFLFLLNINKFFSTSFKKLFYNFFKYINNDVFSNVFFISFFSNTKLNFFNSIRSFFLFKFVPDECNWNNMFNSYINFRLNIVYLDLKKFNINNNLSNNTSYSVIFPKFPFLRYAFKRQFITFSNYFVLNKGCINLFKNLKYLNIFFLNNYLTFTMFLNSFFFWDVTLNKSFLNKNSKLFILYNNTVYNYNSFYKHNYVGYKDNINIKIGDIFKISFFNKFVYFYIYKYLLKIKSSVNCNNLFKSSINTQDYTKYNNFFKKKNFMNKCFTYKNLEISYISWVFVCIYNINMIKYDFFLKNYINLYSVKLYN